MEQLMAWIARLALVLFILLLVWVVAFMRIFKKAGRSQLLAVIPVVNAYVFAQVAGKPGWWGLAMLFAPIIPIAGGIVSLVLMVLLNHNLAQRFGKGGGFTVGLTLLNPIFCLILAFGSAQYLGSDEQQQEIQPEEV